MRVGEPPFRPGCRRLRRCLCLVGVALLVLDARSRPGARGPFSARRRSGQHRHRLAAGRADLSDRPRHGAGAVHGRHPRPGRRQAPGRVLQGRPARQERRCARQDRSASLSGRARSGEGAQGARRRGADRRAEGPGPFPDPGAENAETQQNLDLQQAKVDQTKASIDADMAAIETAQTNLDYTDIVAPTRRPHGRAHGRSRQYRACQRSGRDRNPDSDRAIRRPVHAAGANTRRRPRCGGARRRSRSPPTTATTCAS